MSGKSRATLTTTTDANATAKARRTAGNTANLDAEIASAIAGSTAGLYRRLEIGSGLPGPRANVQLAVAFTNDCVRLGAKTDPDPLLLKMANLTVQDAPGGSPNEFLVMCGVLAFATRAAISKDKQARAKALALLEERADDLRFRVRDAVVLGLVALGSKMGSDLADRVKASSSWMENYFQAAAVVRALTYPEWLDTFDQASAHVPVELLHSAFMLAHDAPRSAIRYPGHKALVEALAYAPHAVAKRFPQQMFDQFTAWAEMVKIPELRDIILKNLDGPDFKKARGEDITRIKALVEASQPPPRDPTILRHGTRGRGKKRKH